jgi:7-cyano-7-deazaguanine synthase
MNRRVVLLSGGLDSTIAFILSKKQEKPVVGLYVDLGQPYASKEEAAVRKIADRYGDVVFLKVPVVCPENNNVPTIHNQIIDGRNLTLAALAANYGDEIWLSALKGEMHDFMADKSPAFFIKTGEALTQAYGRRIVFKTPFAYMTKAEIIKYALSKGIPLEVLQNTSTCYSEDLHNCGECSTCFKRWVAFRLNDIDEPFKVDPRSSDFGSKYLLDLKIAVSQRDFSHYSKERIRETFLAVGGEEYDNLRKSL